VCERERKREIERERERERKRKRERERERPAARREPHEATQARQANRIKPF